MSKGSVKAVRLHLEFRHHVGVRSEGSIAAGSELRLSVQRPFIAAHIARCEVTGGASANLAVRSNIAWFLRSERQAPFAPE